MTEKAIQERWTFIASANTPRVAVTENRNIKKITKIYANNRRSYMVSDNAQVGADVIKRET